MTEITTKINQSDAKFKERKEAMEKRIAEIENQKETLRKGGGDKAIEKQHKKGRMTARERIEKLIDDDTTFHEFGVFAAFGMYSEFRSPAAAGVICGFGTISKRLAVIVAHDATVKAGAHFEVTLKKTLRAQKIAMDNHLPIIYLVDSAGVFLPLQDQVFPDEQHFGRIFYNNARMSAMGIPQIASVMGPCVAGGAYLPVMCDKFIMTEGGSMFLAGPALVKAAIGQEISEDELGGATTHNAISGTADYHEKDDDAAISRIRSIMATLEPPAKANFNRIVPEQPLFPASELNGIFAETGQYDTLEIIKRLVDGSQFDEYKATYGKTIVCGTARIDGFAVGIVANQRLIQRTETGQMQMGSVIYNESADKAARFVMNCNQDKLPIVFLQDVNGFMVGRDAEWAGIAKDGAKLVNAVSNSVVPKFTVVLGGSYGAGNYALCGRAYDPRFMFAWPTSKIAVMSGESASKTLAQIQIAALQKRGEVVNEETKQAMIAKTKAKYDEQSDARYAAARMWVDEVILPEETREWLSLCLEIAEHKPIPERANWGVFQV